MILYESQIIGHQASFHGSMQMAFDAYLYNSKLEEPILRLYWFQRPCLTLGFSQKAEEVIAKNPPTDVEFSYRISGGKSLLHVMGLTYTFAWPRANYPELEGLIPSYESLSQIILSALLEFDSNLAIQCDNLFAQKENPVCFLEHKVETISRNRSKIVGSAQKRGRKNCLQHGEIRLFESQINLSEVIQYELNHELETVLNQRVSSLFQRSAVNEVELKTARAEVAIRLEQAFSKRFGKCIKNSLKSSVVHELEELAKRLYLPRKHSSVSGV